MHDTGGEHITNTFRYKHHAIPVPEVTATDCILQANHHLTAAIEGIQEAAPDKLQAIKSLCRNLLGEKNPQQLHTPPPTPLHDSDIDKEPIHMWDPTSHAQTTLALATTSSTPQTGCAIINNDDDAPPCPVPLVQPGHPTLIQDNNDAPPPVKRPQTQAQLFDVRQIWQCIEPNLETRLLKMEEHLLNPRKEGKY
jgi:hypothetical protein